MHGLYERPLSLHQLSFRTSEVRLPGIYGSYYKFYHLLPTKFCGHNNATINMKSDTRLQTLNIKPYHQNIQLPTTCFRLPNTTALTPELLAQRHRILLRLNQSSDLRLFTSISELDIKTIRPSNPRSRTDFPPLGLYISTPSDTPNHVRYRTQSAPRQNK